MSSSSNIDDLTYSWHIFLLCRADKEKALLYSRVRYIFQSESDKLFSGVEFTSTTKIAIKYHHSSGNFVFLRRIDSHCLTIMSAEEGNKSHSIFILTSL